MRDIHMVREAGAIRLLLFLSQNFKGKCPRFDKKMETGIL